jgi:large subunit ribosomal protein L29
MEAKELRSLGVDELRTKERELREEVVHLRMRRGVSQLESPTKIRTTRRDLARVLTVMQAAKSGKETKS